MKIDLKKINFKQPKYMIPLLIFLPLLFVGYHILSLFDEDTAVENTTVVTETVNTDMPDVDVNSNNETKSKYQAMLEGFGKNKDMTAVMNIDVEEEEEKMAAVSAYDDTERRRLDSLTAANEREAQLLKDQLERQRKALEDKKTAGERNVVTREQAAGDSRVRDKGTGDEQYDRMVKQMQLVQKMANGERIMTEEDKMEEERKRIEQAERKRLLDSIALAQAPLTVNKAGAGGEAYFNTISRDNPQPNLIKARVDQVEKVKSGSRIRLKLDEDIEIDGTVLPKGAYLYASVTGFTAQRVKANVTSVLLGDRVKRINLSVYDIDGMEGFYVPSSDFREVSRDIAASSMNMNVNMNNGDEGLEAIAMRSLQQAIQGTTQAISNRIRQNKAKIKFNTNIYLVDHSNN